MGATRRDARQRLAVASAAPATSSLNVRDRSNMRTDHLDVEQNKMLNVHVLTMALRLLDKIRYKCCNAEDRSTAIRSSGRD